MSYFTTSEINLYFTYNSAKRTLTFKDINDFIRFWHCVKQPYCIVTLSNSWHERFCFVLYLWEGRNKRYKATRNRKILMSTDWRAVWIYRAANFCFRECHVGSVSQDNSLVSVSTSALVVYRALFPNSSFAFRTQEWCNLERDCVFPLCKTSPFASASVGSFVSPPYLQLKAHYRLQLFV
jgi:hypothetical protein